jgi:hypothetical protein
MKSAPLSTRVTSVLTMVGVLVSLQLFSPVQAAYTVKPKIGQCFQLTPAQVSASYATKNPVSCSSTHNAETFEVVDWPLETNPVDMVHTDALKIANDMCGFWDTFPDAQTSRLSKSEFNYWAWYTPDKAAWARGEHWLRCDAMVGKFKTSTSWPPYAFISWKGVKY